MFLDKVTAFVIRDRELGQELLVIKHPTAGYQLPAEWMPFSRGKYYPAAG
jgi:hypothetical protein